MRPAIVRRHGGGWRLFAFGYGAVGWWWRLLVCGVRPAFVRRHGGGWRLFAFGFGVVGWWSEFSRLWCEVSVCSLAWMWLAAGVCSPLVLAWLVGGGSVCLPVVPPCLLARYVVGVCLLWFTSCCRSFGKSCQGLGYPGPSQCVRRYASLEEFAGVCW